MNQNNNVNLNQLAEKLKDQLKDHDLAQSPDADPQEEINGSQKEGGTAPSSTSDNLSDAESLVPAGPIETLILPFAGQNEISIKLERQEEGELFYSIKVPKKGALYLVESSIRSDLPDLKMEGFRRGNVPFGKAWSALASERLERYIEDLLAYTIGNINQELRKRKYVISDEQSSFRTMDEEDTEYYNFESRHSILGDTPLFDPAQLNFTLTALEDETSVVAQEIINESKKYYFSYKKAGGEHLISEGDAISIHFNIKHDKKYYIRNETVILTDSTENDDSSYRSELRPLFKSHALGKKAGDTFSFITTLNSSTGKIGALLAGKEVKIEARIDSVAETNPGATDAELASYLNIKESDLQPLAVKMVKNCLALQEIAEAKVQLRQQLEDLYSCPIPHNMVRKEAARIKNAVGDEQIEFLAEMFSPANLKRAKLHLHELEGELRQRVELVLDKLIDKTNGLESDFENIISPEEEGIILRLLRISLAESNAKTTVLMSKYAAANNLTASTEDAEDIFVSVLPDSWEEEGRSSFKTYLQESKLGRSENATKIEVSAFERKIFRSIAESAHVERKSISTKQFIDNHRVSMPLFFGSRNARKSNEASHTVRV